MLITMQCIVIMLHTWSWSLEEDGLTLRGDALKGRGAKNVDDLQ